MVAEFFAADHSIVLILLLSTLVLAAISWPWFRQQRQRKLMLATPFPNSWRQTLKQQWPLYRRLPAEMQLRLKKQIQIFVAEKEFVGCNGLQMRDEIKVLIAAQACLLTLNLPLPHYPHLKTILVYPEAFAVPVAQADAAGVVLEQRQVRLGESWQHGQLVLSWLHSQQGAADPTDGHNLVFHEFAHQLDQQSGVANGTPMLAAAKDYLPWQQVLTAEFNQLTSQLARGEASLFDPYAATNAAEFFAVVSEVFFEQPKQFKQLHSALYQQLSRFYRQDPSQWTAAS